MNKTLRKFLFLCIVTEGGGEQNTLTIIKNFFII